MEASIATAASDRAAEPTERPSPAGSRDIAGRALLAGAVLAVAMGLALRLHSASALWLDEALSVNIASLPLPDLVQALRRDGSPPLYYLALHFWMELFGSSDTAVRALSTVFAAGALPATYLVGRRAGGASGGAIALVLLAACPFAVRYATETRMYALLMLLSALWLLALQRCAERPSWDRILAVALASGLLALTHYWAFFVLAAGGAVLLAAAAIDRDARRNRLLCLAGMCCGGVLMLPWLPIMLFQLRHTGTPWAEPPDLNALSQTLRGWTGYQHGSFAAWLLALTSVAVLGLALARKSGDLRETGHRRDPGTALWTRVWPYAGVAVGALVLGVAASRILSSGFAVRYSSPVLIPAIALVAIALTRLPPRERTFATAALVVLGLILSVSGVRDDRRTQAAHTAAEIRDGWAPGDLVVYCPDQLGPAVSRLLPPDVEQVVYPTLAPPQRVDWVDYAQRNAEASPLAAAGVLAQRAPGAVWLVMAKGYRTFDTQCQRLDLYLRVLIGDRTVVQRADGRYFERQTLVRFARATG